MMDEKEFRILKNSMLIINAFTQQVHHINSAEDFIRIHNRNMEAVIKIANYRNSKYLKEKIAKYPILSINEVREFIKIKRKDRTFFDFYFGNTYRYCMRYMKTGSITGRKIKLKMSEIKDLNKYVLEVIEDPYMENVYKFMKKDDISR